MNVTFLYVGAVYFAGAWLWRRWATPFPWRVAMLFYALVATFFFQSLVLSGTEVPVDHTLGLYPWRAFYYLGEAANAELNDVALQMAPWAHQVRESWRNLEAPLWNSAAGGGYPLLANGQSAALSVLRLIALPLDLGSSLACEAALKVLVALTFAFLYMRRRGVSPSASILTAISYGFCSYLTIWLYFGHSTVAAFLPAVFYAIDLIMERPTYRRCVFAAVIFTALLLGGHPETAAHTMFAAGLYVLYGTATAPQPWKNKLRALAVLVGAGVLAILLSLPFLLPFMEALPKSQRYELIHARPHRINPGPPLLLVPFFQVGFYGGPHEEMHWGAGISEFLCGYAGVLGAVAWFALLFVLIRTKSWRTPTAFYVIATPLVLGIVLGWAGLADLIHSLPLYSMAANGRLRVAICWFLAVLAGEAVELLIRNRTRAPLIFGVSAVGALLMFLFLVTRFPNDVARNQALSTMVPRVLVLLVVVMILWKGARSFLQFALVAAVVYDLWSFGWSWYRAFPKKYLYPETPLITELKRRETAPEPGEIVPHRIAGASAALFPNTGGIYGFEDIRAHDPMAFGRVLGALRVFSGYTSDQYFGFLPRFDDPFIDYLNVRYVVASPFEDYRSERFQEVYSGPDGKIYKNLDALPRFYAARNVFVEFDDIKRTQMILDHRDWRNSVVLKRLPTQQIEMIRDDLFEFREPDAPIAAVRILRAKPREFRLDIDAPRWTLIIGSQPNWPGWRIHRNGSERLKQIEVNAAFMGFLVPPGRSDIQIVYAPRSYYVGLQIALVTLVLLSGGLAWQSLRRRRVATSTS
jgi:hypothetical protein